LSVWLGEAFKKAIEAETRVDADFDDPEDLF
jgi:hypothetical protein